MDHVDCIAWASSDRTSAETGWHHLLTVGEAVMLAEVPEKRVRKDIETGVLTPKLVRIRHAHDRVCFSMPDVYVLAAVYGSVLSGGLRKIALDRLDRLDCTGRVTAARGVKCDARFATNASEPDVIVENGWAMSCKPLYIDDYLFLDMERVCERVKPRVDLYSEGLNRIEEKAGVLSGDAVFKNSRLSVCHVGKMYDRGEPKEDILRDYPYLKPNDVEFARLYYLAHPPVGRPRTKRGEDPGDHSPSSAA